MKRLTKKIIKDVNTEFNPERIDQLTFRLYKHKNYTGIGYTINHRDASIVGALNIRGGKRAYNKSLEIIKEAWTYFSSRGINTRILESRVI